MKEFDKILDELVKNHNKTIFDLEQKNLYMRKALESSLKSKTQGFCAGVTKVLIDKHGIDGAKAWVMMDDIWEVVKDLYKDTYIKQPNLLGGQDANPVED